jgi:hypothetical protein
MHLCLREAAPQFNPEEQTVVGERGRLIGQRTFKYEEMWTAIE